MEALVFYFLKVILCSAVLFLYYKLFLKDKTFHQYNRFYLLLLPVVSLLLPLLKVRYFTLEANSNIYLLLNSLNTFNSTNNLSDDFIYFEFIAFAFGMVSLFFLTKFFFGILQVEKLKNKFRKEKVGDIDFYQTDLHDAPFSFFQSLFWKDSIALESDLGRQILQHEIVHIEQKHSHDKILIEIITSVLWFNPVFHLVKTQINLIHEYLADKKAVTNSDTKAFAQMLLASRFSGKAFPVTSPFLSSNLKKRLTMLKKSKTQYSYARRILALPLLFALAFIYMVNAENKEIKMANADIDQMIFEMKKDTIRPPALPPVPPVPAVQNDVEAPTTPPPPTIPRDLQLKERKLKEENDRILENNEGAQKVSAQMKLKSDEFKKAAKGFEIDQEHMAKLSAEVESRLNSDDFKIKIQLAEIKAREAEKLVNSPAFRKKIKEAEKRAKEVELKINSPEFQQKIREAEANAQKAIEEKPLIYIDGKLSDDYAMNQLDPALIDRINVNKKGFNGNKTGEIHITTKK